MIHYSLERRKGAHRIARTSVKHVWPFLICLLSVQPSSADQFNDASRLYDTAVRGTVLIVNDSSIASGVLIDSKLNLVATNAHVTNNSNRVDVFFAAFRNDRVIEDRRYYTKDNLESTKYYTSARVVTEDFNNDVAIIQLDSVPSDAIEFGETQDCAGMTEGDPVIGCRT